MIPAIWPGDTVIIKRQNPEELRSGDVVLAERDGSFVVHRVQHVRQEAGQVHFETQGDSVPQPDPVGTREQILGKVIAVQRGGRTVGIKSRRSITERIVGFALSRSTFLLAIWLRLHSLSASAALPIVSAQQSEA
jgi:signal peptidase I